MIRTATVRRARKQMQRGTYIFKSRRSIKVVFKKIYFVPSEMKMRFSNVRFAVKTVLETPSRITGRYQCTTEADRDMGPREWFKPVSAVFREINMNE